MGMTCQSGLRNRCIFVPLFTNLSFLFKLSRIHLTFFLFQHNDFNIKEYHETSSLDNSIQKPPISAGNLGFLGHFVETP